ncbi:MAG TPA: hypothetical protein VHP12_08135 [Chitinophagaceae bacterium]|nr:hypothetical protein [Chitinophagaceae bacterium]
MIKINRSLLIFALICLPHAKNAFADYNTLDITPKATLLYSKGAANCPGCPNNDGYMLNINNVWYYLSPAEVGEIGFKAMSAILVSCFMNSKPFMINYYYNDSTSPRPILMIRVQGD